MANGGTEEGAERALCPGVRELEHTADLGILVEAPSMRELFHRAARGMTALLREDDAPAPPDGGQERTERSVSLRAEDVELLLARWLQELLYLRESEGFVYDEASFRELAPDRLVAAVRGRLDPRPSLRELKSVTYHGLEVSAGESGWRARVIFDV